MLAVYLKYLSFMSHMDKQLSDLERKVWTLFYKGIAGRRKGFHFLNIGTLDEGMVRIRTVILRQVSASDHTLFFHTDARSRKFKSLSTSSAVSVHAYDHRSNTQVIIRASCICHRNNVVAIQQFNQLSDHAKLHYRKTISPFTDIEAPCSIADEAYLSEKIGSSFFVWVAVNIQEIEVLQLSRDMHKRAIIDYVEPQNTRWVQP